jgi:hypothetical protein
MDELISAGLLMLLSGFVNLPTSLQSFMLGDGIYQYGKIVDHRLFELR